MEVSFIRTKVLFVSLTILLSTGCASTSNNSLAQNIVQDTLVNHELRQKNRAGRPSSDSDESISEVDLISGLLKALIQEMETLLSNDTD